MTWLLHLWVALVDIFQPNTVAATLLTTIVGGALVYLITAVIQRRFGRERVRRDLIARVAATTASMQSRVQHYARRASYGVYRGHRDQQARELAELERQWVDDEARLRALHVEIDAYFGVSGPGRSLHYVRDLLVIQYMQKTEVPPRQRDEAIAAILKPHDEAWLLAAPNSDRSWDSAYQDSIAQTIRDLRSDRITRPYGATRSGDGLPKT